MQGVQRVVITSTCACANTFITKTVIIYLSFGSLKLVGVSVECCEDLRPTAVIAGILLDLAVGSLKELHL